jgi:hypothetical protein
MDIYETTYLMTVNSQLAGQAFMDALAVIFAIIVTGYFAGPRLTNAMFWGLTVVSASFIGPMIMIVRGVIERTIVLSQSLPMDQLEQFPYLQQFANIIDVGDQVALLILTLSLVAGYAGAIYFVHHCRRQGTITAAS